MCWSSVSIFFGLKLTMDKNLWWLVVTLFKLSRIDIGFLDVQMRFSDAFPRLKTCSWLLCWPKSYDLIKNRNFWFFLFLWFLGDFFNELSSAASCDRIPTLPGPLPISQPNSKTLLCSGSIYGYSLIPYSSNYFSIYSLFLCILIYEMILLVGLSNKLRLAIFEFFESYPFLDRVFLLEESFLCWSKS